MDSLLIPAIKNGNLINTLLSEYFKEKNILTSNLGGGEPNSSFMFLPGQDTFQNQGEAILLCLDELIIK
jgi:hypothetical protein